MRLGIGTRLSKTTIIDPTGIPGLVGWWDFTRADTMFQNRDGTTAVASDMDPIHCIRNLANGNGAGDKLGAFLRSSGTGSTYGATFKTGGLNGKTYAQFAHTDAAADANKGLRGGYFDVDSNLDGGIATNKFSNLVLNMGNVTTITVAKHDDVDIDTANDSLFYLGGCKVGDTSTASYLSAWKDRVNPDLFKTFWGEVGLGGYSFSNSDGQLDDNPHVFELRITDGAGNMKLYIDGTINSSPGLGNEDINVDFSKTTGATDQSPAVGIGGSITMADGTTLAPWHGRVYEHMVYSRALTDTQIALLELYLGQKYNITFS